MRVYLPRLLAALLLFLFALAIARKASPKQTTAKPNTTARHAAGTSSASGSPGSSAASAGETAGVARLPVHRVVLYKNGMGYFEHVGRVHGSENVRVDFTSGQLNDVLKSLTILDLNGGRITGVDYNSEAPLSQLLGGLRLPLGEKASVAEFFGALRGAKLEARSGSTEVSGRLLSVERKTRLAGGTTLEVDVLSIVTEAGELHEVELTPGVSVRVADRDMAVEVSRYLGLLASVRDQDLRRVVISTTGTGERQLYVSYISEVPVWKTTYRIVLPAQGRGKPLLQGWAIVDNTVGEDWNNVELSLVAGAPQSFIQQLSVPYYVRRPVIPLPESAQLTPQTHEGTLLGGSGRLSGTVTDPTGAVIPNAQVRLFSAAGQSLANTTTDNQGKYEFSTLPAGNYRLEFEAAGFQKTALQSVSVNSGGETSQAVSLQVGSTSETVEVTAESSTVNTTTSSLAASSRSVGSGRELGSGRGVGNEETLGTVGRIPGGVVGGVAGGTVGMSLQEARRRLEAAAQGRDLGDLFEYKVKQPVTIHKNQSALVPIVQTNIGVEKVSLWNPSLDSPRPLRALWVTNSSPLTLDGGSFSVLEDETFAGEGLTEPLKPGERRLLSYAADLGVRVDSKVESQPQRVSRVRIARGTMVQTSELQEKRTYAIRNEDAAERIVVIEHPVRPDWKLSSDTAKPDETSSGSYRFRMVVEPKSTATLAIQESKPLDARYEITNLSTDQIALFLRQGSINPEVEQALRHIAEQKNRVADLEAEVSKRETERDGIFDDQQRLRENLKSLKGSAEERALTQRYAQQLADQETRLETLRREIADYQRKQEQAQSEMDDMIQQLSLDATLSP